MAKKKSLSGSIDENKKNEIKDKIKSKRSKMKKDKKDNGESEQITNEELIETAKDIERSYIWGPDSHNEHYNIDDYVILSKEVKGEESGGGESGGEE